MLPGLTPFRRQLCRSYWHLPVRRVKSGYPMGHSAWKHSAAHGLPCQPRNLVGWACRFGSVPVNLTLPSDMNAQSPGDR